MARALRVWAINRREKNSVSNLQYGPRPRLVKVLANEDTLLLMMFLVLRKLGNICCGHKMFLNKIRNIFCVPDTKFVSATNVARAGKRRNICVGNNVSSFARTLRGIYATIIVIRGFSLLTMLRSIPFYPTDEFKLRL